MKARILISLLGFLCLAPMLSVAQGEIPKAEVTVGYSLINAHPDIAALTSFNLNGGGGAFVYNFGALGFKADFFGYNAQTNTVSTLFGPATVSGNLFTYLFGPQFKKHSGRLNPFGEALFGAAHTNAYPKLNNVQTGLGNPSNNAFAMEFGLGLDYKISQHFSIRPVEVDYLYTKFTTNLAKNSQNNFKYVGGITIGFGKK